MKKSNKNPTTGIIIVLVIVFVFVCLIKNSTVEEKEDTIKKPIPQSNSIKSEETILSEILENNDFQKAFTEYNRFLTEETNDEELENVRSYFESMISSYETIDASGLFNEYESNIVRADKEYTGKPLCLTGVVNNIGKTNNDKNICIGLESDHLFYGVQLNFGLYDEDKISALVPGDTITVIGVCDGKSRKQLLVLDGENVMITGCVILD